MRNLKTLGIHKLLTSLALILMFFSANAYTKIISHYSEKNKQPYIIDTDMGDDDWMAISYLLSKKNIDVKAITIAGDGMSHCRESANNAEKIIGLSSRYKKIPIACGAANPIKWHHAFPKKIRQAMDNILNIHLHTVRRNFHRNLSATTLLRKTLMKAKHKVTIVAIGPLTNIAMALNNDPKIIEHIKMIYIMGGAISVKGNVAGSFGLKNKNTTAEWNFYVDPVAAHIVLNSGAPITLIPLDATNQAPISMLFYHKLEKNRDTLLAKFVFHILEKIKPLIKSGVYDFWDPLAAAIATNNELATFKKMKLAIKKSNGVSSGRVFLRHDGKSVRVTLKVNLKDFEKLFIKTLNNHSK